MLRKIIFIILNMALAGLYIVYSNLGFLFLSVLSAGFLSGGMSASMKRFFLSEISLKELSDEYWYKLTFKPQNAKIFFLNYFGVYCLLTGWFSMSFLAFLDAVYWAVLVLAGNILIIFFVFNVIKYE